MNDKESPKYHCKMKYIPSYYEGLSEEQQRDQRIILDFKEGKYDEEIMLWFRQNIWRMTKGDEYAWSVCFLPCSSKDEQQKRFGKLAEYLKENTRVEVHLSTFGYVEKHSPSHLLGKNEIDLMNVAIHVPDIFAKKVILIDDIITTGETFYRTAEQTMRMGANYVYGLFLAKTIHPNLPKNTNKSQREINDTIIREEAEIMNNLSNLPLKD